MPKLNDAIRLYMGAQQADAAHLGGVLVWTAPAVPVNTSVPVVTGAVNTGDTASTTNGTWSGSPSSYTYQWQVDPGTGWENIPGETANTFGPIDDAGEYRVRVIAINAAGASSPAYSASFVVAEPSAGFVWGYANAVGEIINAGATARRQAAASGYANFRSSDPLPTGKFYVEGRLQFTTADAAFGLIGDGALPSLTDSSYVLKWATPNASVYIADVWSLNFFAAYGLPEEVNGYFDLDGSAPAIHVVQMAVDNTDPSEVLVWIRINGGAWYGSGNPAAGTGATITLPDTVSLYLGAVSQNVADTSTILTPDTHENAAPAGFTPV